LFGTTTRPCLLLQSGDEENHSSRGRDQGKAESHQHQFLFHGDLLFSVSVKVPEQRKDSSDRHHVLELFGRASGSANRVRA
jgi:hypothetical protein